MKRPIALALTLLAGVAIGGAAIQRLHAQAKPPTYVVIAIQKITDADSFKTGVVEKTAPAAIAAAGGRYVVRTQSVTGLDGAPPQRFVVIAFDSVEKAQAWHNSAAQKEIDAARMKSTDSLSFLVEGMSN
ncbi:MAG: DUF1330 domain-containing protein [Xanthobacteraceae bacterium]